MGKDYNWNMSYDRLSDERLAEEVSRVLGMSEESALRAVRSDDPDLGRSWAIGILRRENMHQEGQARLSEHLAGLRRVAT